MCYALIDRIIIGGSQSVTGKEREIEIVYKIDIVSVLRHKGKNNSFKPKRCKNHEKAHKNARAIRFFRAQITIVDTFITLCNNKGVRIFEKNCKLWHFNL